MNINSFNEHSNKNDYPFEILRIAIEKIDIDENHSIIKLKLREGCLCKQKEKDLKISNRTLGDSKSTSSGQRKIKKTNIEKSEIKSNPSKNSSTNKMKTYQSINFDFQNINNPIFYAILDVNGVSQEVKLLQSGDDSRSCHNYIHLAIFYVTPEQLQEKQLSESDLLQQNISNTFEFSNLKIYEKEQQRFICVSNFKSSFSVFVDQLSVSSEVSNRSSSVTTMERLMQKVLELESEKETLRQEHELENERQRQENERQRQELEKRIKELEDQLQER